jgi:hypothetical protein
MPVLTGAGYVEAVAQALDSLRTHPLRASLASVAMAAAVATTAVVQTGLNGLERSTREAGARAFGSDSFVIAKVAGLSLSRREFAERVARNPNITRGDVRFLDRVANDRVLRGNRPTASRCQRGGTNVRERFDQRGPVDHVRYSRCRNRAGPSYRQRR